MNIIYILFIFVLILTLYNLKNQYDLEFQMKRELQKEQKLNEELRELLHELYYN
jgi:hypothetical protein